MGVHEMFIHIQNTFFFKYKIVGLHKEQFQAYNINFYIVCTVTRYDLWFSKGLILHWNLINGFSNLWIKK